MKDWIPFFQALIWPVFAAVLLLCFQRAFRSIVDASAERIRQGAPFEAGPSGLKLLAIQAPQPPSDGVVQAQSLDSLPHPIYMTHSARRDSSLDRDGQHYYRLRIWMDADEPALLDRVKEVCYHLHPTFRDPDRLATDRRTAFAFHTAAWGEFNMTAEVRFLDGRAPLLIERYINFLPTSV